MFTFFRCRIRSLSLIQNEQIGHVEYKYGFMVSDILKTLELFPGSRINLKFEVKNDKGKTVATKVKQEFTQGKMGINGIFTWDESQIHPADRSKDGQYSVDVTFAAIPTAQSWYKDIDGIRRPKNELTITQKGNTLKINEKRNTPPAKPKPNKTMIKPLDSGFGLNPNTNFSSNPASDSKPIDKSTSKPKTEHGDNFEKFSPEVLKFEGGYVNNPNDKGGPTNRGIAWDTWQRHAKNVLGIEPTLDNLKALSKEGAEKIYKEIYWSKRKMYEIEDTKVAFMIFDWTITSGGAIREIQMLLNNKYGANIKVDGGMGSKTAQALNDVEDQRQLLLDITEIRKEYYKELVIKKPENEEFLEGWLNRVNNNLKKEF